MTRSSCRRASWLCGALFTLWIAAFPAAASTLLRVDLDELSKANELIVLAEVVDATSYWNAEGTFILTDVRLSTVDVLKGGRGAADDLEVTVMGGTVGDLSTIIVGGAELVPGHAYVLFLNHESLPGAPRALTVRDHVQGVFELRSWGREVRAVSQAVGHPLVPDVFGRREPPGGAQGLPLQELVRSVRQAAGVGTGRPR